MFGGKKTDGAELTVRRYNVHYIEGCDSASEGESELGFSSLQRTPSSQRVPLAIPGNSPPLVLAFSACRYKQVRCPSPSSRDGRNSDQEDQDVDCDEPIEEWMILEEEEQDGDRKIQLNLGYWSSGSSESDSGDEEEQKSKIAFNPDWAISAKDKGVYNQSRPSRYYTPDRSLTCHNCNKTGHLVRNCPIPRKRPTCVLCGLQGHFQRACPGRHCPSCGLPSHGYQACPKPPVWYQHCHRCGMTGHLSDGCPDTWRQYHLTTQDRVPHRPHRDHAPNYRNRSAHCYNCSRRGHYGHECTVRRMISGTFPSLPYVCRYDDLRDNLIDDAGIQKKCRDSTQIGDTSLPEHKRASELTEASGEEEPPAPKKRGLEARREGGRRKTWPERRRERRKVKMLRREAQARREGGLGTTTWDGFDKESHAKDMHRNRYRDSSPPLQKRRNSQERGRRSQSREKSRKSREAERWKKKGGMKRGDLYLRDDLGPMDETLLSIKHRVRNRRS
ncbi:zinc finger CCHC domain-containing protein 7-like [Osmerus eperlanus]|uniref:zinc finger CCHC domain-containing protein 7-like n=1 Tax=Osmerus eperlanus TaxID=29151 RepID=UPI002E1541A5